VSESVDRERAEAARESAVARGKKRIEELMLVNRLTYEGLSVTLIAERMGGCKREKVRWLQRVLGWRAAQAEKWLQRTGKTWGDPIPMEAM
jgi:hypothetical protein